jgi:signal transduction histidine kinase/ligand-binding sensor domain-containing protein
MQRVVFLLACFFIWEPLTAQPATSHEPSGFHGQYPFVHYTPKDGMVSSRVRKAFQDSRGKMYFLTYSGLSVYDGARFRNYTKQSGLLGDLVNDMLEITPDSFLVAINSCGLNALVNGQIKQLPTGKDVCPVINHFLRDRNGNIYTTTDQGLFQIKNGIFERLSSFWESNNELVIYLGDIADHNDYLIFTTNDLRGSMGLFLYSKKEDRIIDVIPGVRVHDLKTGPDGNIWIYTPGTIHNLDTLALAAGKLQLRKPYGPFENEDLPAGTIHFTRQHELFIFATHKGSFLYKKDGTRLYIPSPGPPSEISKGAFIDREDILWISNDGNGVYKLANTRLQYTQSFFSENSSGIRTVTPLAGDSAWFVMNDNTWILRSASKNKIFSIEPAFKVTPLISTKTHVYAVSEKELFKAPLNTGNDAVLQFSRILKLPDSSGFGGRSVEDPFGNIILHERLGLAVIQHDKRIASLQEDFYDLVEGMYIAKNKRLWIVSRSKGLRVFSLHPEDPDRYLRPELQFFNEFEKASPRCMVVDKNELLWVGTRYDGLMCFELKNSRLEKKYHFRAHDGLTDNFVTSLACDGDNNIIAGTQTGLDKLIRTPAGFRIENITKSNNIFNLITQVWTDRQNNAFGLTNTMIVLQSAPAGPGETLYDPSLIIEEIKINGESLAYTGTSPRLRYYQRNISFAIAAPTFIDEKQVQYSYRLAGNGNNEWSEPGTNADIGLLNLSPGRYTLEVKATFPSTSYAPKQIAYSFEILPPWWQTLWFRVPAAFFLLAVVMFVIRLYYRRKLEKEKTILEKQQAIEKERTRIATDMHDDLGAGLSRIKFLSETIGIKKQLQQPIEDDISSIRQYSHEMIDKMGEIVWALNEKNDSLSDLLAYTRSYAVEYLSQNGIHCTVNTPDLFPATFVSGEYRRNIYLVVKEALHNIVKHAQATEVVINIGIDRELSISIKDNGIGFGNGPLRAYSNGLSNMKKRMEDIGGKLEIGHEKGTVIQLLSPMP